MTPWEELQNECNQCRACALSATRKNVVFGAGNTEAEVLFIGEGPGANEDEQGLPFVGAAGKLLDDMLAMIGLKREAVYITNIVKCRPPQNRDPLNTEKDACIGYLRRQVAMMRPKIIVCLGRIAATELIKPDFKITQRRTDDGAVSPRRPAPGQQQEAGDLSGSQGSAGQDPPGLSAHLHRVSVIREASVFQAISKKHIRLADVFF